MSRLIDADALIAWIKGSQQMTSKMKCVIAKIETMPGAVSVVHGEWIEGGTFYFCGEQHLPLTCSVCGRTALNAPWTYCPNCGAKMKGADDE